MGEKAVQALSHFGDKAVPILAQALKDANADVRYAAALALSDIGPAAKDAVPALVEALKDPVAKVRERTAYALGGIGPAAKDALPALVQALKDSEAIMRRQAWTALTQIAPQRLSNWSRAANVAHQPQAEENPAWREAVWAAAEEKTRQREEAAQQQAQTQAKKPSEPCKNRYGSIIDSSGKNITNTIGGGYLSLQDLPPLSRGGG